MSRYRASTFSSLLKDCVLWAPLQHSAGVSGDIDEFPIIPSGVTVTYNGTFTEMSLGNNKSVLNFTATSMNSIALSDNDAWYWGTGNFTIGCWFRFHTLLPASTITLISQNGGTAVVSPLEVVFYHSGNYRWYIQGGSSTGAWDILNAWSAPGSKTSWTVGTWYYITVVRNGTSLKLKVDNVDDISVTIASGANFFNSASTLDIGRYQNTTNNYPNINVKDLMIFKGRALTQPEIKLLMNRTHPIDPMTLEFYRDYQELFVNCNGYWDLRNNVLPIIGTVSGTVTEAVLTPNRFGLVNQAYLFDGTDDKITMGNTTVSIKSVLVWVKLSSTTQPILKLTDTPHTITVSSGTLTITGWPATVVIYVDGAVSSTISDANWHCVCITTSGSAFTASNLIVGYDGTAYLAGSIGEVLTFSDQISAVTVKTLYNLMRNKCVYPVIAGSRELS